MEIGVSRRATCRIRWMVAHGRDEDVVVGVRTICVTLSAELFHGFGVSRPG